MEFVSLVRSVRPLVKVPPIPDEKRCQFLLVWYVKEKILPFRVGLIGSGISLEVIYE
jgi:hypothetical protein